MHSESVWQEEDDNPVSSYFYIPHWIHQLKFHWTASGMC